MARGKPLGNKRERERAKARKKREKDARRQARKLGTLPDGPDGPMEGDPEAAAGEPPLDDTGAVEASDARLEQDAAHDEGETRTEP